MPSQPTPARNRLPSQEALLLDYAERLDRHRAGRRALHIHLSALRAYNRRDQHLRAAINTFENLVRQHEGQIFVLGDSDIVFVCKGASIADLDRAVLKLRYLFSEDPIAHCDGSGTSDRFCTWYDIERDHDEFLALARKLVDEERERAAAPAPSSAPALAPALKPLEPDQLNHIVNALARADVSSLIRRQSVCAILQGAPPQPVFRELYVSIGDLQRIVAPTIDIASNRWLFQYLTETLDRRMLATLPKMREQALSSNISLNLNLSTLLSREFLAFDAAVQGTARGSLVIELQLHDVLADMGSYLFVRDFVRERGYRICLDGVSYLAAPLVERERLGLDLFKVIWSTEMSDSARESRVAEIRALVDRAGAARAILCRCDDAQAIEIGKSIGISLFQGRHVESLLAKAPRK